MLQKGDPQRVLDSESTKEKKIILLWLMTQIDYRGTVGEEAIEALHELIPDREIIGAYSQIVGFASASPEQEVFEKTFTQLAQGVLY